MRTVTSKDGTTIAYETSGRGPALILVDGALCYRASGPSRPLAKQLEPKFTVYAYDRRGRGDSTDTQPFAVEREVEDIAAIIEAAGGSAYVYGISSGAALALEAANTLGGKIKKLALYEAPFIVDGSLAPRPDDLLARMRKLAADDRRSDAVKLFMKTVGVPAVAIAIMRFTPAWPKLTAVAHTIPYDFAALEGTGAGKPLPAGRWARATMPTLVMNGGKSPAWMSHAMRALAEVLPRAQHRTLEGQTHMLKPEVLAPALVEFFQ